MPQKVWPLVTPAPLFLVELTLNISWLLVLRPEKFRLVGGVSREGSSSDDIL